MLLGPAKPRFPSLQNQSGHVFIAGIWQGSTGKHLWGNSQRPAHRVQPGTLLPFPPWFPWRMMGLGVQSWKSLWSMSVLPSSSHNSPFYHIPGSWEIQARLECRLTTSWSGLSSVDSSYCQKVLLTGSQQLPLSAFCSCRILTFKSNSKNNRHFLFIPCTGLRGFQALSNFIVTTTSEKLLLSSFYA